MRTRIAGSLGELGHDVRRGRQVGIAHAEIDHVLAAGASARLHGVHLGEHVRRQALQTMEFRVVHGFFLLALMYRERFGEGQVRVVRSPRAWSGCYWAPRDHRPWAETLERQ